MRFLWEKRTCPAWEKSSEVFQKHETLSTTRTTIYCFPKNSLKYRYENIIKIFILIIFQSVTCKID